MGHTEPAAKRPTRKTAEPSLTFSGTELVGILEMIAWRDVDVALMLAARAGITDPAALAEITGV